MKKPIILTLTGPSATGKDFLATTLINKHGYNIIVSVTSRQPRPGEIEGITYYFRSAEEIKRMRDNGEFAEYVEFNGVSYGTTHAELDAKLLSDKPFIIIVTPDGVREYAHIAEDKGATFINVFVTTDLATRLKRLNQRLVDAISDCDTEQSIRDVVAAHTKRIIAVVQVESKWFDEVAWSVVVPGDDVDEAVEQVKHTIERISYSVY